MPSGIIAFCSLRLVSPIVRAIHSYHLLLPQYASLTAVHVSAPNISEQVLSAPGRWPSPNGTTQQRVAYLQLVARPGAAGNFSIVTNSINEYIKIAFAVLPLNVGYCW